MLNFIVLAGKIVELPVLKETVNGTKYATVVLEVTRPFKNSNSQYENDRVVVTMWKGIAETASSTCKLGDTLGIKGRIQTYSVEKEHQTFYNYEIIAEHVSFMNA